MDSRNGGGTIHLACEGKFRTKQGIVVVRGNQQVVRQCLVAMVDQGAKLNESTELSYRSPKTR